jgi:hypothetical protein
VNVLAVSLHLGVNVSCVLDFAQVEVWEEDQTLHPLSLHLVVNFLAVSLHLGVNVPRVLEFAQTEVQKENQTPCPHSLHLVVPHVQEFA